MTETVRPEPPGRWRELVTPEGVDLRLKIGDASARFTALLIDLLLIGAALAALTLVAVLIGLGARFNSLSAVGAIWLVGAFVIRNFYFTGFELRPGAATPGKRRQGLRVAARDGGRLTADAVFTRNALRELELFLPLSFLMQSGQGGWAVLAGLVWAGVFALFPLFNRDRLRVGDLLAGTMVVESPRRKLLPDLSDDAVGSARPDLAFTLAQLDAYGVKELHVLETVLRGKDRSTQAEVAARIRQKIDFLPDPTLSDRAFLDAYYAALRGRLERRLLFGHRRADKHDVG